MQFVQSWCNWADCTSKYCRADSSTQVIQSRCFKASFYSTKQNAGSMVLNVFFCCQSSFGWINVSKHSFYHNFSFILNPFLFFINKMFKPIVRTPNVWIRTLRTPTIRKPMLWSRKWRPLLHSNDAQWHSGRCKSCINWIDAQGLTTRNYVWDLARYGNCMQPRE